MKSRFNYLTGLYEQVSTEEHNPAVDTNAPAENIKPVENTSPSDNTGKLHAFIIDQNKLINIEKLISGQIKEYKAETPLKIMGADGSVGGDSMINGKPIYLMIRIANKSERASKEIQLELSDRVYLLLDTNSNEIKGWLDEADDKDNRVRISVKTPTGKEHSVELWNEVDDHLTNQHADGSQVNVDMDAQIENPGTAAGITGTTSESAINEQDAKFDIIQNQKNKEIFAKANADKKAKDIAAKPTVNKQEINELQKGILKALGSSSSNNIKRYDDGTVSVYGKVGNTGTAYFYGNGRFVIVTNDKKYLKGTYKNNGKTFIMDGNKTPLTGSIWTNINKAPAHVEGKKAVASVQTAPAAFKDQSEGDAFRQWANSTPELAAKYGKKSKYDLDPSGKFNNSFINKSYAAAKDEYLKHKEANKDVTLESKYKVGDVIYYRDEKKEKAPEVIAENPKIGDQKKELEKSSTGYERDYIKTGGNPELNEGSIATSFATFKAITEDEGLLNKEKVDADAGLIKDTKEGNIKKGIVIKEIDSEKLQVKNLSSEKEEAVLISNIIDKTKAENAKAKADALAAAEAEKAKAPVKSSSEVSKDKLDTEKSKTKAARQEKRDAKSEFKDAKKNKRQTERFENKAENQEDKQAKIKSKTDKLKKKTEKVNTSESVVYSFDEFIKSVNKLN